MLCNKVKSVLRADHWGSALRTREVLVVQLLKALKAVLGHPLWGRMIVAVVVVSGTAPILAQTSADQVVVNKGTLENLMQRIDQLESRVRQLEAERQPGSHPSVQSEPPVTAVASPPAPLAGMDGPSAQASAASAAPAASDPGGRAAALQQAAAQASVTAASADAEQNPSDNAMMERMDVSRTLLRIRGFGDISLHGSTQQGDTTSFSLGQLDLFVTSDVSDKFKFLSEIVFEGGPDNIYGQVTSAPNTFSVDVERYLLQYSHNDYFNVSAGRGHTAIGYYNTAYHHSSWLQTTTGRPFIYGFEDRGGILPIHTVGVTVSGQVPSGSLGLHYVAEVGNGRASRTPLNEEPVQNVIDDQNHKAYNLAVFARPEGISGLQTGFSYYNDLLAPTALARVNESIMAAHAVLIRPHYEWLNEALLDRHTLRGTSQSYNTPAFYSQVSKQFGAYRPYLRYEYVNVPNSEPIFPDVQLRHGPSAGLRFDASESVALKFQYDYTFLRNQPGMSQLALQMGFTF